MLRNNSKGIKVSVIMPSLNVGDYIDEAMDSARKQTLDNMEILCIDAGSNDGTWEIIKEAEEKDKRIRAIKCDIKSYGLQVNKGIRESCGEYIAVLETDDFICPEMYEILYDIACEYDADYAKADYRAFFTQDDGNYFFFPRHSFSDRSMYNNLLEPLRHPEIARADWYLWQGIYKREFITHNNIQLSCSVGAAYQDIGFLFRTGISARRAVYIDDLLYSYRIDRESASSNQMKGLQYSFYEFDSIMRELEDRQVLDDAVMKMLYARMSRSFVSSCTRIKKSDWEKIAEIYICFMNWFKEAIEKEWLNEKLLGSGLWKRLLQLQNEVPVNDENRFDEEVLDKYDHWVIFGCGEFGFRAYRELIRTGKKLEAFWDNNKALEGQKLNGVIIRQVLNPQEVPAGTQILIANELYYDEMMNQLIHYGFDKKSIWIYR